MKDVIAQIGLVVLGLFLVSVLILGSGTNSMKKQMESGVQKKLTDEITILKGTSSAATP